MSSTYALSALEIMSDHHTKPTILTEHKNSKLCSLGYGDVRQDMSFSYRKLTELSGYRYGSLTYITEKAAGYGMEGCTQKLIPAIGYTSTSVYTHTPGKGKTFCIDITEELSSTGTRGLNNTHTCRVRK